MQTSALRQLFLDFFVARGHKLVASSSVVGPTDDPTVMWTNAGMLQFKDIFLGKERREYTRAVTSQKCLRAGGKHNDLDQVGFTTCHHTFFEMLGNFSFGDYSKSDAIQYAWEFITGPRSQGGLELDPTHIWVTVFEGNDSVPADIEAEEIWTRVGLPKERIMRFGSKDNFWQMGDTGPCGPCSEIHYDRGPQYQGDDTPNGKGDRVIEIWNLVFMHYDREQNGTMKLLPKPSIDTGMGLERVSAILQGVSSNYEIDLFLPIFEAIWKKANIEPNQHNSNTNCVASRVIADHIRAATFMIYDGIVPSNEGRGYVLRKIIRRALRFGRKLGINGKFFSGLCPSVTLSMGSAYPELRMEQDRIIKVIDVEEERFATTLDAGLKQLESLETSSGVVSGSDIFKLYDTYGFSVDLVEDWCKERGLKPDLNGFQLELSEQKAKGRSNIKTYDIRLGGDLTTLTNMQATNFVGYETMEVTSKVVALFDENQRRVTSLFGPGFLLLECTPFYANSGGQLGDTGVMHAEGIMVRVEDCTVPVPKRHLHHVDITGQCRLHEGDVVLATVDCERRTRIEAHHTATHLVHAALRKVLGTHVRQAGSVVNADKLRLDFSHFAHVKPEQIAEVEQLVNKQIFCATNTISQQMPIKDAIATGATALFGEKYGDIVRVTSIPGFSSELCGGTHVTNTGKIGLVKIISEGAVAAGIRRIEAVAGIAALNRFQESEKILTLLSCQSNSPRENIIDNLAGKNARIQQLEKELKQAKLSAGQNNVNTEKMETINGITLVIISLVGVDSCTMRELMDQYRARYNDSVIAMTSKLADNKISILISVGKMLKHELDASDLLQTMAPHLNSRGGGKKDLAQGGGTAPEGLKIALVALREKINNQLQQ
jgi:alanyl-tRNA synthetase